MGGSMMHMAHGASHIAYRMMMMCGAVNLSPHAPFPLP